jgi:hypothetical protein
MKTLLKAFFTLSIVFCAFMVSLSPLTSVFAQETTKEPIVKHLEGWKKKKGDWIVVNVEENTLEYVRDDYSEVSEKLPVGSGMILPEGKKFNYLGLSYRTETPEKIWSIESEHQQNWYNVFGSKEAKEQLFLRLYEVKGEKRIWTHYGIHTTPEIDSIFKNDAGFGSWGCILARYDLLKNIQELYLLNDKVVRVVTTRRETQEIIDLLKAF